MSRADAIAACERAFRHRGEPGYIAALRHAALVRLFCRGVVP